MGDGITLKCRCGEELRLHHIRCPNCGLVIPFSVEENAGAFVLQLKATEDPAAGLQLPAVAPNGAFPANAIETFDDTDFATLALHLEPSLHSWARLKLARMIGQNKTRARKARRRGLLANILGNTVGGGLLVSAIFTLFKFVTAPATAPFLSPLIVMAVLGAVILVFGLWVKLKSDTAERAFEGKMAAQQEAINQLTNNI